MPEIVEADEAGETRGQGVRAFGRHVKELSLENGSRRQSFQQRSCAIRCVIWRSHPGVGWVGSELGWAGIEDIVQLATWRLSPEPFPGYLVSSRTFQRARAPESHCHSTCGQQTSTNTTTWPLPPC